MYALTICRLSRFFAYDSLARAILLRNMKMADRKIYSQILAPVQIECAIEANTFDKTAKPPLLIFPSQRDGCPFCPTCKLAAQTKGLVGKLIATVKYLFAFP